MLGNSVSGRWENQLKPDIDHSAFDPEEDALILKVKLILCETSKGPGLGVTHPFLTICCTHPF